MGNRFAPLLAEDIISLIAVAKREKAATVWIKNGRLANLFTGEIEQVHIAIYGKRIAYVGLKEPLVDTNTEIIDAQEYILMPGYIEPHAHPFQLYHPFTLADYALTHGTTTLIADNLSFFNQLDLERWFELMEEFSHHPVKYLWWSRLEPQSSEAELQTKYDLINIERLLQHPAVIQGGELSHWLQLLSGDPDMASKIAAVKKVQKRIEGHAPGASEDTLNALAAAGVTSDHEAITAEEVMRRLRLGLYAPLRHSSIRPDLPVLLEGLKDLKHGWERMMLTTDGSTPPFLAQGFTDALLTIALQQGIEPIVAYRMATLNIATYYGLDEHIGSIAPSRYADILFLQSLEHPNPQHVMVEGKLLYNTRSQNNHYTAGLHIDWEKYQLHYRPSIRSLPVTAHDFRIQWDEGKSYPIMHLINDVITVQADRVLPVQDGYIEIKHQGLLHIALVDRKGRWITRGLLSGFANDVAGLATTYTISSDYLVIGNDFAAMLKALQYVQEQSGVALVGCDGEVTHLPLPIGGGLSALPMHELIEVSTQFQQKLKEKGFAFADPYYCLLFLTSTHLPKLRITEYGIVSIKDQQILLPSEPLR